MRRSTLALERIAVAGAVAFLAPVGCRGPLDPPLAALGTPESTPRHGGTLRLATFGDITTMDPAVVSDQLTSSVLRLVYAGLVDFDAEGHVVPDLAAKIEVADAGLTYRFTLHQGVRFHDGSELTADDVKRSIERALGPSAPSGAARAYQSIDGLADFTQGKAPHLSGVVVEGRDVLAIHLSEPDTTFLPTLALVVLRPTCPSAGDRYHPGWAPCGAGPFRVVPGGWEHGRSLTLVRNESYFRPGLPYLDAITWELGSPLLGQGFKFARGEIDIVRDLNQDSTLRYQADPRWQPFGTREPPGRSAYGEAMNTEVPPFDNVEVRRAVAAAIDRDHLVLLKSSNLSPTTKPVPEDMPDYQPSPDIGQHHDLAAALDHMRKAGYAYDPATGRGGWTAVVPYELSRGIFEATAQLVQQDLAAIGIRIELRIASYPTYLAVTRQRGKTAISPQGSVEAYPDPYDFIEPRFATKGQSNRAFYSNPTVDALVERGRREGDPRERSRLYAEVERIVCDDAPWAFEYSYRFYEVHQPYVRGYRMPVVWVNDLIPVWLDKPDELTTSGRAAAAAPFAGELLGSLGSERR